MANEHSVEYLKGYADALGLIRHNGIKAGDNSVSIPSSADVQSAWMAVDRAKTAEGEALLKEAGKQPRSKLRSIAAKS